MNKNRRKRIADLRERIDIIKNELEEVMEEEQDGITFPIIYRILKKLKKWMILSVRLNMRLEI